MTNACKGVFVAIISVAMSASVLAQGNANLVKNGSFENSLQSWNTRLINGKGKASLKEGGAVDGQRYVHVDIGEDENSRLVLQSTPFEVEPGKTYHYQFQYYTGDMRGEGTSFRIIAYDRQKVRLGYYNLVKLPLTANVWVTENGKFKAGDNCTSIILEFNFRNNVECKLDNVVFEEWRIQL